MRYIPFLIFFWFIVYSCSNHGRMNAHDQEPTEEHVQHRYETSAEIAITTGSFAPSICLPSVFDPNEFVSMPKGDTCLVMFWASWCPDCDASISCLKKFLLEHKGVKLLTISLDTNYKDAYVALKKKHIKGQHLYDEVSWRSEVARTYNIQEIPQFFLIAPDTRIINFGPKVEELLHKSTENR